MNAYFLSFSSSSGGRGQYDFPCFSGLKKHLRQKRRLVFICNVFWLVRVCRDMIGSWSHTWYFRFYHSCCNLLVVFFSRMTHSLQCETQQKLARDAYIEDEDTFEIFDPRNPINKRRREASKKAMKDKRRWHQGRAGRFVSKAVQGTSAIFGKSSWNRCKSCRVL